jgi:hypothetical protein
VLFKNLIQTPTVLNCPDAKECNLFINNNMIWYVLQHGFAEINHYIYLLQE